VALRLLKITTNYPDYLERFYSQRPGLADQPYVAQHTALMTDSFGWADFWSVALRGFGYEANEVITNAAPMQKRWAIENGITCDGSNPLLEITVAQVEAFQPDVLFVNDYVTFTSAFLKELKVKCPSIRLVLGWCGAPYPDPSVFYEYDIVLSCIPEFVRHFREEGHNCHHINHAFDQRILTRIDPSLSPTTDFSFIGSVIKQDKFHSERERLLLNLVNNTKIQIWSEIVQPLSRERRSVALRQRAYDAVQMAERLGISRKLLSTVPLIQKPTRWKSRPDLSQYVDDRIARRARRPLFGLSMFQKLRDSKVVLNTHIDVSPISASNMRLYEGTGVGTCLLTDWKANLSKLFEPDVEVVTYRSSEECAEKVEYLLAHDSERRSIAIAGQQRTLRDHTFAQRAEQLDSIIRAHI
jgi:spore maturation protein CgeB